MNKLNSKLIAKTLEKLHSGESMSNREINTTIEELEPVVDLIGALGKKFFLFKEELFRDLGSLKAFQVARKKFEKKYGFEIVD